MVKGKFSKSNEHECSLNIGLKATFTCEIDLDED